MRTALACLLVAACQSAGQPDQWNAGVALTTPADLDPDSAVYEIELEAREANVEIVAGKPTPMLTYNGTLPGPLIQVNVGTRVVVHFHNALAEPTTVHWHGMRVDNVMDGGGMVGDIVQPGGDFLYDFVARDAGTFWYHSHVASSRQVSSGLYGGIVVNDPSEPFFGDEQVLILSDVQLRADGTLQPDEASGTIGDWFGREGDTVMVNGRKRPELRVRHGVPQRWRIINAARTRFFVLELAGQHFTQIGGDGGLLPSPRELGTLTLTPGERMDVVVRTAADESSRQFLQSLDAHRFATDLERDPVALLDIAYDGEAKPVPLPSVTRTIDAIDLSGAAERTVELMEVGREGGAPAVGINGKRFPDVEPFMTHVGAREVWTLKNTTSFDHPFHLHGFFFQPLDGPLEWKDTINVPKKNTLRVAIHFDERPGMWMFHCHILDHADNGMMGMLHLH